MLIEVLPGPNSKLWKTADRAEMTKRDAGTWPPSFESRTISVKPSAPTLDRMSDNKSSLLFGEAGGDCDCSALILLM